MVRVTNNSTPSLLRKIISLFSVVRGYNIAVIVMAQYLASVFIFAPQHTLKTTVFNPSLFFIVLATICTVAAGYIINNFYDAEKDSINKPIKTQIDNIVAQQTQLTIYFALNFIGVIFGLIVSWKASLFFAVYIFLIWFYSHKLKRQPLLKLVVATALSALPFFVIFVFYQNFSTLIFIHGCFLFLILSIRELIKELENIKGDLANRYITVPIKYGEPFTKKIISLGVVFTFIPIVLLLSFSEIGYMKYYFYLTMLMLLVFVGLLSRAKTIKQYNVLHNFLKFIILSGVVSMALIDTDVLIKKLI
ncbi:geranylgeranylglycerol-phosphate geranylgeranyltransferase [Flavobacteriaceae bacterium F08102]|nr:geranylgeranylglycerol-phosphate geranylgeranyltransferase [Flavobacteriaceae bacterium F08102]